ncbi:MAG TPA: DinB family protein [Gemmataceae bacterium]|jgi:hypothetical protein|nr:DinB family protein [Gemmataceae bacterium]
MPTLREATDTYLAATAALRSAVAGMSRDQVIDRPVPGKWSTLEVVCHIADFEPIMADRMKRVIAFDRPQLLAADENGFAKTLAYHDRDLEEELTIIETTRRQMARILKTLPESAAERVGMHSERGPKTLMELLVTASGHIAHHVPFILAKRQALGLSA